MDLTYREAYWDDAALKAEFIRFLDRTHNLNLTAWDRAGFWDPKYRPFSYFEGDRLVANVCVHSMKMTANGRRCRVAQVSAVGTQPEYRRRGLNLKLTERAIAWAQDSHEFFFLFADEEAFPFYQKCGFRRVEEFKPRLALGGKQAIAGEIKMNWDQEDHRGRIIAMAGNRAPVSNELGVSNLRLFLFWCLYFLKDNIYYIPDLDVLVLYKREGDVLTVCDIVGEHIPAFSDIYPYISKPSDRAVEFLFMPDRLNLGPHDWAKTRANGTHVLGELPFEHTEFIFPLTAHA